MELMDCFERLNFKSPKEINSLLQKGIHSMFRILYSLAVSSLLVSLSACASGKSQNVVLTVKDAGRTLNINQGDVLEVTLEGNPSTGYSWEPQSLDTTILRQKGDVEFQANNAYPGLVGSPGMITLRFEAVGAGQTALKLIYHRSFEPSVPPEETFEITVIVK
jgi:inhibitor of cysteine peptidase